MSLAMVFPGQGSQSVGMLSGLAQIYPDIQAVYGEASQALGYDLWKVVQEGPEAELNQTECTQPAMLCAGVALWRLWRRQGGAQPRFVAGHSLGEYTALVCAGALNFTDALRLVAARARFMQEATPAGTGSMAAVLGLADDAVTAACAEAAQGEVVEAVNFNAPGQVVIAGHRTAVERAVTAAKARGAKRAVVLPVSVPSHCGLMRPAAQRLAVLLAESALCVPEITVIHNVDARSHAATDEIRAVLVQQLYAPVQWVAAIRTMVAAGVSSIIECGPGKVLTGLNKRISPEVRTLAVFDKDSFDEALSAK